MWNAGKPPARMIEIISPAGFEGFFREAVDMVEAGPPTMEAVSSLSAAYGLEGGEAEWLPGVIARYGLTPPPGM